MRTPTFGVLYNISASALTFASLPRYIHRTLFTYNGHFYLSGVGHFCLYFLGYFKA
jgi:hypothetical protein